MLPRTFTLLVAAVAAAGLLSCSGDRQSGAQPATIVVGIPPLEQNILLYIADHENFFGKNGLRIVLKDYPTGVAAIEALRKGEVDIAEAAEFPFVRALFEHKELRIIACNDKFENDYLLAHKDRGITEVSHLRGKKIGLARGTITEFYLDRFLMLNGMKIRDVRLVDLEPSRFIRAFAEGEVDAVIAWQPYVYRMQLQVHDGLAWKAQSGQPVFGVLIADDRWLAKNRDPVVRFLKSLHEAENFIVRHPGKAMEILQDRLGYDESYVATVWPLHKFSLTLDQALVIAMKDEALWLSGKKLGRRPMPDFAASIYTEGMQAVKPDAVDITR